MPEKVLSEVITDIEVRNKIEEQRKLQKLGFILSDTANLISESIEGAIRIKKIVQDLKGFSRSDGDQHSPSDINAGIESTLNIVWNEIKYKASVKKEFGAIPLTRCNAGQLNQVFKNIIVFAGKRMMLPFTPPRSG